uniref:RING-type domain-containing protein n=1 Tax=Varanus komodoensis TaxID=61221 RepID=A0A8D2KS00_VARKO
MDEAFRKSGLRITLRLETTCPICLEHLKDPVTLDCGHNYCQACISKYSTRIRSFILPEKQLSR